METIITTIQIVSNFILILIAAGSFYIFLYVNSTNKQNKAMKKWKKKYNKRFYKKPCADCYCKDCKYFWNGEGVIEAGACEFYGKDTPDDGFCWRATRKE